MKKITREEAINLFRQQWADMQKELGDCPDWGERDFYKQEWCAKHNFIVSSDCFLCEWANQNCLPCKKCPIDWGYANCWDGVINCEVSPISKILALPERRIKDETN